MHTAVDAMARQLRHGVRWFTETTGYTEEQLRGGLQVPLALEELQQALLDMHVAAAAGVSGSWHLS